jgi:hypothetical protein
MRSNGVTRASLVIRAANHLDDRQPASNANFLLQQRTDADSILGDQQSTRHVIIGRAEVFALGQLDDFFKLVFFGKFVHRISPV